MWKTKEQKQEYDKQYYLKNREQILENSKQYVEQNREKTREYKRKYKTKQKQLLNDLLDSLKIKCSQCEETTKYCLEFNHLSDKFMSISRMRDYAYSIERIKEEISKCDILCSNCHRKHHFKNTVCNNQKGKYVHNLKLNSSCQFCKESHIRCLDFHHLRDKITNIGVMIRDKQYSLQDIINELNKCICVCSNCHRKLHHGDIKLS